MQRISLGLPGDDNDFSNHFQRGSLDTITLNGSNMGDLEALWIGIESGLFRRRIFNYQHIFAQF